MGDNAYKKRHREMGLCTSCSQPTMPTSSLCMSCYQKHLESNREYIAKHRAERADYLRERKGKLKSEGRCVACGIPLIEGEGTRCVNCNEIAHHHVVRGYYETITD